MSVLVARTLVKTTGESIAYGFDFSRLLTSGETISSVTSVVATGSGTALSVGTPTASTTAVAVRISGGSNGSIYRVTCTIVTSLSNTRIGMGNLEVSDEPL